MRWHRRGERPHFSVVYALLTHRLEKDGGEKLRDLCGRQNASRLIPLEG
jgi:hypothetical protein